MVLTYDRIAIGDVVHSHLDFLNVEVHFDGIGGQVGATISSLIGQCLEVDLGLDALCNTKDY